MISGQNSGQETVGKTFDTLDVTTKNGPLQPFYTYPGRVQNMVSVPLRILVSR